MQIFPLLCRSPYSTEWWKICTKGNCVHLSSGSRIFLRGAKVGVLTYYFAIFFSKTAWKWKNLDLGGVHPWQPLGSANGFSVRFPHVWKLLRQDRRWSILKLKYNLQVVLLQTIYLLAELLWDIGGSRSGAKDASQLDPILFITTCKLSLGQGHVYTPVCDSFWGVPSLVGVLSFAEGYHP